MVTPRPIARRCPAVVAGRKLATSAAIRPAKPLASEPSVLITRTRARARTARATQAGVDWAMTWNRAVEALGRSALRAAYHSPNQPARTITGMMPTAASRKALRRVASSRQASTRCHTL